MFYKLKELREYEGLTQNEVAKILNVTRSTYAGWECGKDIIPIPKLNDLANFYHVSLDYLVGNAPKIEIIDKNYKIDNKQVSKNIKKFRKDNKLTQKSLANKLNTSQSNIHKYENGKSLITTTYALEFAKQYDISLDDLLRK